MKAAFVICVSGFTQNRGYFHGIMRLREELLPQTEDDCIPGMDYRVWYITWKDSMQRVANELSILCNRHGYVPKVMLVGYSYGGWGALRLAFALQHVGIEVEYLVLSDPVGRSWWWPRPLPALSSMLGRWLAPALRVPSNVKECFSFYQLNNRPQGHKLRAINGTVMHEPLQIDKRHQRMDDATEFHQLVIELASKLRMTGVSIE